MARVRVGIVGCGHMATNHEQALRFADEVDLVAVADIRPEAAETFSERYGPFDTYADCGEMCEQAGLDFVIIASQGPHHVEPTLAAANSGVHVLCEKPMALTLSDCDRMVDACRSAGVKLAINHQRRVSPFNDVAKDLMVEGWGFGELVAVEVQFTSGRTAAYELMEVGTHFFDWVRIFVDEVDWCSADFITNGQLAGLDDVHLSSEEGRPDQREEGPLLGDRADIRFGAANGVLVRALLGQWPHVPFKGLGSGIDLIGTEGRVIIRGEIPYSVWRFRGPYMTPALGHSYERILVPAEEFGTDGRPIDRREAHLRPLADMYRDMVDAIREDRDHVSSGEHGRAAQEMVFAAWESHVTGRRVSLPLEYRGHPLVRWQREAGREPVAGWVEA
jgi:UDP-N-acetyl-2-amino-2-deoxyglucuronate dehydrogenase